MKGYYPHGPLQRVELGEYKVQGMDYAYTLQGWLKGINSDRLQPGNDMGQDGLAGTPNEFVGRDAFGESIGYFGDEDYKAIDATRWGGSPERPFAPVGTAGTLAGAYHPLYNGNIGHTVNSLQPWGGWTSPTQPAQVLAQVYKYDQLNRLKQAQGVEGLTSANTWNGITDAVTDRYKSKYTYDANGNIETAERFDETGQQYDDLEYHYEKENNKLLRNRLYHLNESINGGYGDIGVDGSAFHGAHADVNALNNYQYDELGNLIADKREQIANIEWTVAGKVKHITRTPGSTKEELTFTYGPDGQRTSKTVGDPLNGGYREYYLRDAQGNVMAMYKYADNGASLKVTERPVYGSSRLGSYTRQMELMGEPAIHQWPYIQPMQAPLKRYELTDHLGNVNTVVTGRLLPGNGAGSAKQAEVVSATGYESFGSLLPGRNWSSELARFGFGGQLKDNEVYCHEGTSYTAEFWQYDPRTGRRWNLDPVVKPWQSGYGAFSLNPIWRVDPNGDDDYYNYAGKWVGNDGQGSHIRLIASKDAFNGLISQGREVLREQSRIVTVKVDDAQNAMHLLYSSSVNDGYEHKAYVILNTSDATLSLEGQPRSPGDDDKTSINTWENKKRGTDKFKSPPGDNGDKVIVGQVHGHPGAALGYTDRVPGTSSGDAQAAKDLGTPVYAVDANNIWKVDQNGNESGAGVCSDSCFPLLQDALQTSGGKPTSTNP